VGWLDKPAAGMMIAQRDVIASQAVGCRLPGTNPRGERKVGAKVKSLSGYVFSRNIPSRYIGELNQLVRAFGEHEGTLLFRGVYGVGKTHLAQAIHDQSFAEKKHFVLIRCDKLNDYLLPTDERPLFDWINGGSVPWKVLTRLLHKGCATINTTHHPGAPQQTRWVTYYFDEAGRLPKNGQSLLLKALTPRPTALPSPSLSRQRIIASSSERLEALVEEGQFNASLQSLLQRFQICLPALRDRQDDIPYLAALFIEELGRKHRKNIKGMSDAAIEAVRNYSWPGNIRELRTLIAYAVEQADVDAEVITCEQLLYLIQRQIQILDSRPSAAELES